MRETSEEHWIWDGMVLDVSTQRPLLDGLLRLAHGVNAGQHPTVQTRADRPPRRFEGLHEAVCLVVGSLAYLTKGQAGQVIWRPLGAENYTGGEVSRKQFKSVVSFLIQQGYLELLSKGHDYGRRSDLQASFPQAKSSAIKDGIRGQGKATRWVTTKAWHELCEEQLGLKAETMLSHFVTPPTHPKPREITSVLVFRNPEPTPERFDEVEQSPQFRTQVELIEDLNRWLLTHTYSGLTFNGLQRHFHGLSFHHYGRLHAPFQNIKSDTRRHLIETGQLRINDCPVVEVDIASSQPQLLWGRYCFDQEPDYHDLYSVILERTSRIDCPGLTRELVKRDVVEIIGREGAATRTHSKPDDPNKVERQRLILERTPWLSGYVNDDHFSHGQLVHRESEALLMAMQTLRRQQIPSLPIHDSLLVGLTVPGAEDTAIAAMEEAWGGPFGQVGKGHNESLRRTSTPQRKSLSPLTYTAPHVSPRYPHVHSRPPARRRVDQRVDHGVS